MSTRPTDLILHCPYTGLRSFTEEESLYFKGRDLQADQITALLEQNKFLMVTGASGEGKSSLIFAGLIPNARAGFFKAKYTNWLIASFRPERSPLRNLAQSLAAELQTSTEIVETELKRGYSSLVDLYTASSHYTSDEDEATWPEVERKDRKRKAANLMILVDQFEEFFTNPENFHEETPSTEAQTVVNLILETAALSISRNLPIYIVCTMRSDYIGQCSAFRGLPEYIGFSQFFVPRLKRKDLKEVIEEPALLSGNRISQRLIERLVYDVAEGVDQLPILQHALSRIWQYADRGIEEMDLIHYAMVGGMPATDLPDEDQQRFYSWFSRLPLKEQEFYKETGLQKVVEIHANLLYENAWEYYTERHSQKPITQREAKRIVALCFSCLTRIDNSRAVRNRMSLGEITAIINTPHITHDVVAGLINIFREEGNSFIRPFITSDPSSRELNPSTILDITHESLIRNWNKLNQWAEKEFEYYSTFQDFSKQLERWRASGKSRGYLLPIGPLTFFENWYKEAKPNEAWISRYAASGENAEKAADAASVLDDTKQFLRKSASKVLVTRAFMKYGPMRIATGLAILLMLVLTGYYWYDANQKKNDRVIERLKSEAMQLTMSPEVNVEDKATYLLVQERYDSGTLIKSLLDRDVESGVKLGVESYKQALFIDKLHPSQLKDSLVSRLYEFFNHPPAGASSELLLTEGNKFAILLTMDDYYLPTPQKQEMLATICAKNLEVAKIFLANKQLFRPSIPSQLNLAIQWWLTKGNAKDEQIRELLLLMSPKAGEKGAASFAQYYPSGNYEINGRLSSDFNGGYHTLACLYAAVGDTANLNWCFGEWLKNDQRDYFEASRVLNNHLNVIGYLYQFNHRDLVPGLLKWLGTHTNDNPPNTLLRNAVIRAGYITHLFTINIERTFHRSTRGYIYPNLYLMDRKVFDTLVADYVKQINLETDPDERHFQLAMNSKRMAMFYFKYWYDRHMPLDSAKLNAWCDDAIAQIAQVSAAYLQGTQAITNVYNGDGVRTSQMKRRSIFIYPDYRDGWFAWVYHGDYFFNYLDSHNLLGVTYTSAEDLQILHYWVMKAFEWKPLISPLSYSNDYRLPDRVLQRVLDFVNKHSEGAGFDQNMIHLVLANRAFENADTSGGVREFGKIKLDGLVSSSNRYEYLEKTFIFNMMNRLAANLAGAGMVKEGVEVASRFETGRQKVLAYSTMAERLYRGNADPNSFEMLDSAYATAKKVDYSYIMPDVEPRFAQILTLSEMGSRPINLEATEVLRQLPENIKMFGVASRVAGIGYEGNFYNAVQSIPSTLTESQDLLCHMLILMQACEARENKAGDMRYKRMNEHLTWNWTGYYDYTPN